MQSLGRQLASNNIHRCASLISPKPSHSTSIQQAIIRILSNSATFSSLSPRSQTQRFLSNPLRRLRRSPTPTTTTTTPSILTRRFALRRHQYSTTKPSPPSPNHPPPTPPSSESFSRRLKTLSREYGWSALGVYLALSALDFPFCFIAVRSLGTEKIGHWEHVIVETVKSTITWPLGMGQEEVGVEGAKGEGGEAVGNVDDEEISYDHGYKEAVLANKGDSASIWTQLALAYAIHKSFIFIRVPLTAAVTPKVVKVLRSWGWNIGKRRPKGVKEPPNPPSTPPRT